MHNGFAAEITQLTRFYLLWRWAYGEASVPFDDARKLAQSVGIDLVHEWNKKESFIKKDKEFVRVLGPEDRNHESLTDSKEIIDILHSVLLLWKKGNRAAMVKILRYDTGYGKNDIFYKVAQAISETLPDTSREKKLLDGYLAGKNRLFEDMRKTSGQQRLSEYQ